MKTEYDLSKMKMRKNPYASKLKRQVTIRMGDDVVSYFEELADLRIPRRRNKKPTDTKGSLSRQTCG